ncbi:MAG: transposase [Candidatus Melainabacteria bacterium]|nr:transposase [Candidatus Melainabacteria bacterium]
MAEKKKYKRYSEEFREGAVQLVESGKSAAQVARELGLSPWTVQTWVRQANKKKRLGDGHAELIQENKRLRKELAQAQEEAEILKKAAA